MSTQDHNKLDYIIAVISEFASHFTLSQTQAYRYLARYNAIDFIDRNYDIEHTYSFDNVIDDIALYCRNHGGELV